MARSEGDVSLEVFEKEARAFLDEHATRREEEQAFVWGEGSDRVALFDEKTLERELQDLAEAQRWRATKFDAGFGWITGPTQYGGRGLDERPRTAVVFPRRPLRRTQPDLLRHRARHDRAHPAGPRLRGRQGSLPGGDVPRRRRGLSALLRARRRLGPGQPPEQGRAGRGRVAGHRPEGVDLRRPVLGHRRGALPDRCQPAQAQGPHRVHRRHAGAGRRDPAATPDDRWRDLQRGLLQRGPGSRRPPARGRQRRLDRRADHAHERARFDRGGRRGRQVEVG